MFEFSQLVLLPAPWQIGIGIVVLYGAAAWLVLWSSSFLRRETKNFVQWPLQCLTTIRVVGTLFGFASNSPHTSTACRQYLLITFTYLWDLGFAFLMMEVICSATLVYKVHKSHFSKIVLYSWLALAVLVVTAAYACQASNITKAMEGDNGVSKVKENGLVPMLIIQACLRIYFVLCVVTLGILAGTFFFALIVLRRTKTFSSADLGQTLAFLLAFWFLGLYVGYGARRFWQATAPTSLTFGLCQALPEAITTWIYLAMGYFISRWDHSRQTELKNYRQFTKRYWEQILLDALSYARVTVANFNPNRPTPWIVSRAEIRYGILAAPKDKNQDMIACLTHLQQLVDVVGDMLVLDDDLRMSLWRPRETRRVDLGATMKAVIEELLVRFRPMTRNAAEILARDWCPVFSMDRNAVRQWGESRLASGS